MELDSSQLLAPLVFFLQFWIYCSLDFIVQMVVTKIDKCGSGTLLTNLLNLQDVVKTETKSCFPQPFLIR